MTLFSLLVKGSILLAAAALGHALVARRASAATRHLLWTLAITGLLLLPILGAALPGWTAVELSAPPERLVSALADSADDAVASAWPFGVASDRTAIATPASSSAASAAMPIGWSTATTVLYVGGVLFLLGRAVAARLSMQRLTSRAVPVVDPAWMMLLQDCSTTLGVRRPVALLRSPNATMPMAIGIWRASILIPASADDWTDDRRRAVLLHELAHVARYDCLTQTLALVACAMYWVHPGVWWVARRLRVERELACDDRVLAAGANAGDYAGHLLELAYGFGRVPAPTLAVTMAGSRHLEGRLLAVLDSARNRAVPALRGRMAGLIILAAILVPVAAATTMIPQSGGDASVPAQPAQSETSAPRGDESSSEPVPGTWDIRPAREAGRVHVQIREGRSSLGFTIDVETLGEVTAAQLAGTGPVQYSIRRDAGTFSFEGVARKGVAAGTFDFTPDPEFSAELARRGFVRPTAAQQYQLARSDIGFGFIDELDAQDYRRPDLAQLVRAAEHGVTLTYLREMGQLQYELGELEPLIELRSQDVTPRFVRALSAYGLRRLSKDDLIRARSQDLSPEYIGGLSEVGYKSLGLEELITLRSHDVTRDYVRGLAAHGYGPFDVETVRNLRSHDVTVDFVEAFDALGYRGLAADALVRLRSHDVMPAYVRELQALGYQTLAVEELIDLRSYDVQPEEVRRANDRAGRQLTVGRLTELASNDWR